MKRCKIYVQLKSYDNERVVFEVSAEKYDDHTYLVSNKWKENKDIHLCKHYELIDAGTGIMVVSGDSKQETIDKYNSCIDKYHKLRAEKYYTRWCEEYQALCERAKNNKVDNCEVER